MKHLQERAKVWVNWDLEERNGNMQKVPKDSKSYRWAKSNDTSTWSMFSEAKAAAPQHGGRIGYMFASGSDRCMVGIDLDGHKAENKEAATVIERFSGTYAELSPSGNGYHILFYVNPEVIPVDAEGKWDKSRYYMKNQKNEMECYPGGFTNRFFTYTGNRVSASDEITDQTENFFWFLNTYMRKGEPDEKKMSDIATILDKARKSKRGEKFIALYDRGDMSEYNNDASAADSACVTILAFWLYKSMGEGAIDEAFRGSALYRQKWERADYREQTIRYAIEKCNGEFYEGVGRPRKDGKPHGTATLTTDNREYFTIEALQNYLDSKGITVRHNVITNSIDISGYDHRESAEHILGNLPVIIYSDLAGVYKGVSVGIITDMLNVIATRDLYNPVLERLSAVVWDGKDHLQTVYDALRLDDGDELSRTLIKKWFWQGHALLRNDPMNPIGADGILTLAGGQGIGKTSFFRKVSICKAFFREGQSINADKDSKRRVLTTWIAELGEVDTTLKSDMGMLKAFITNAYDEYRLPYGRVDQINARRTNLGATVNGTKFLVDEENRRFWVVQLDNGIDLEKLSAIDAEQVWAQVWEQYAKNDLEGFRLTKDEQKQLASRNSDHSKELKGESEVMDILAQADNDPNHWEYVAMTVSEFMEQNSALRKYTAVQVGKVLDKAGITASVKKVDGKAKRLRTLPKYHYNGYAPTHTQTASSGYYNEATDKDRFL